MRDTDSVIKRGERAALVSSRVTVLLAIGKGLAGFLTGSLVLITDAFHSATDLLPIMVSWLGLRISRRKPDKRFPYGYYKAESIATLFVSLFIIYVAIEFIIEGYHRLFEISTISLPLVAGSAALLSAVVSAFLARYQRRVGQETGSQSLVANARDTAIDVIASLMVLVAIVLSYYRIPYIEGVAILLLSVLIIRMGAESLKDAVFGLMDISPSREIEKEIIRTIGTVAGVEGFQDLRLRKSGPLIFGEVTVKIRRHVDVDRAHEVSSVLESEVQNKIERLGSFTVHIEPYEVPESRVVVPLGGGRVVGFVTGEDPRVPSGVTLKPVLQRLDSRPLLPVEVFHLLNWAAEYYMAPPGMTIASLLVMGTIGGLPGLLIASPMVLTITTVAEVSRESKDQGPVTNDQ